MMDTSYFRSKWTYPTHAFHKWLILYFYCCQVQVAHANRRMGVQKRFRNKWQTVLWTTAALWWVTSSFALPHQLMGFLVPLCHSWVCLLILTYFNDVPFWTGPLLPALLHSTVCWVSRQHHQDNTKWSWLDDVTRMLPLSELISVS